MSDKQPPNEDCESCGAKAGSWCDSSCAESPEPTSEEGLLKLARESLMLGGADVDECTVNVLARAVIAQADELAKLRAIAWQCPRCGRADLQAQHAVAHRQSCMSRTDDEQRIDELRAALREALDEWRSARDEQSIDDNDPAFDRIAELRRLADGE